MPEALLEAAEEMGPAFDAIIVDEGQDFKDNYWIALSALLQPDGYLYIFFDDNQNLYGSYQGFMGLITELPFPLNQNCRNTKSIHNTVIQFHHNPNGLICRGPDGRPPELLEYQTEEDLLRMVQKLLNKLVNEENVRPEDIAIITPRSREKSILKSGAAPGKFQINTRATSLSKWNSSCQYPSV